MRSHLERLSAPDHHVDRRRKSSEGLDLPPVSSLATRRSDCRYPLNLTAHRKNRMIRVPPASTAPSDLIARPETSRYRGHDAVRRKPTTRQMSHRGGKMADGTKELYALGEIPPLGEVPLKMHAMPIRKDRHGRPAQAMQHEIVPVPEVGPGDVLVYVMSAGVNYNGVWASLGQPLSPIDVHKAGLPHRGQRRLRHRLEGRQRCDRLEGRRRGHHPLQSDVRRMPPLQWRQPHALPQPTDLGLRDDPRKLRAVSARFRPSSSCPNPNTSPGVMPAATCSSTPRRGACSTDIHRTR